MLWREKASKWIKQREIRVKTEKAKNKKQFRDRHGSNMNLGRTPRKRVCVQAYRMGKRIKKKKDGNSTLTRRLLSV